MSYGAIVELGAGGIELTQDGEATARTYLITPGRLRAAFVMDTALQTRRSKARSRLRICPNGSWMTFARLSAGLKGHTASPTCFYSTGATWLRRHLQPKSRCVVFHTASRYGAPAGLSLWYAAVDDFVDSAKSRASLRSAASTAPVVRHRPWPGAERPRGGVHASEEPFTYVKQ